MFYEGYVASQVYKDEIKRVERKAADNWRFRHFKSPEARVATAIITSILGLFIR
jgi:hypothetical protein